MVTIPSDVQRMMRKEQVIVVGTANQKGIPNVSPRSSFYVDYNAIYWYEIFKHKSYQNYMTNNWVSVAIGLITTIMSPVMARVHLSRSNTYKSKEKFGSHTNNDI